jgi:hypothetical protein
VDCPLWLHLLEWVACLVFFLHLVLERPGSPSPPAFEDVQLPCFCNLLKSSGILGSFIIFNFVGRQSLSLIEPQTLHLNTFFLLIRIHPISPPNDTVVPSANRISPSRPARYLVRVNCLFGNGLWPTYVKPCQTMSITPGGPAQPSHSRAAAAIFNSGYFFSFQTSIDIHLGF